MPEPPAPSVRLATAGWQIPRTSAEAFAAEGSTLARYAGRFDAVEINSTFYRSHRASTFERWVETTPEGFRFAVKIPKAITHERKLKDAAEPLARFLGEIEPLAPKLGPLLVQLPPSLGFDPALATDFLAALRDRFDGPIALEPRHPTWFESAATDLLVDHRIARVAADPARVPEAAEPDGWPGLRYWRLHGSPRMYWSPYGENRLAPLAAAIAAQTAPTWCVFDNTTSGAAAADALLLQRLLGG